MCLLCERGAMLQVPLKPQMDIESVQHRSSNGKMNLPEFLCYSLVTARIVTSRLLYLAWDENTKKHVLTTGVLGEE